MYVTCLGHSNVRNAGAEGGVGQRGRGRDGWTLGDDYETPLNLLSQMYVHVQQPFFVTSPVKVTQQHACDH